MIETAMARATWVDKPQLEDITVLICQNKTYDLIRLSLESLLTFYPTINILVVNGSPNDESGKWLKYKEAQLPNLRVWDRVGYDSHGVAMHEGIMGHVHTDYVLLMDSDVIIKRSGVIELMRDSMGPDVFSSGMLMNVTRRNYACGFPENDADVLRYIHPSTGLYDVNMYKIMEANFTDHGAPCVYPIIEAADKGFKVVGLPVADYVMHLSGASWSETNPVWDSDYNTCMRPLVTFVTDAPIKQTLSNYNVIPKGVQYQKKHYNYIDGYHVVDNNLFNIRFNVSGDYVCVCDISPNPSIVQSLLKVATENPTLDTINIDGFEFHKRKHFQSKIAWL